MRRFYILIALLIGFGSAMAQSSANDDVFYFNSADKSQGENESQLGIDHFFGNEIGIKLEKLRKEYTWTEFSVVKQMDVLNIDKPAIYNAVKKLERYYKKGVKKGLIDLEVAQKELSQILDIAINIRHQATSDFENFLNDMDTEEQLVSLFTEKVALN